MENLGFIGFGSMGSMLVKDFIESGAVGESQLLVTRKDVTRLNEISAVWPEIRVTADVAEVVKQSSYVFLCVKPLEFRNVLEDIKPYMLPDKHIISIAGSVSIENIESIVKCKVSKVIPAITSEVGEGISLICHNSSVSKKDAKFIESLFESISGIKLLDEKDFALATELTSCAPGFLAAIFREFVESALRHTSSISREDAYDMVLHTLSGTVCLMLEKKMSFEEVIARVATKGGITEEGVKVIEAGLPQVFDELLDRTMEKRNMISDKVNREFSE